MDSRSSGPSCWWRPCSRSPRARTPCWWRATCSGAAGPPGCATIAGIAGGCVVHAALSAVGVSLILVRSAEAFAALKWGGAAYLVVLGVQSIRRWWRVDDAARPPRQRTAERTRGRGGCAPSSRGCSTNVLNPKVGIFYLAFLPQFIGPGDQCSRGRCCWAGCTSGIGVVWLSLLSFAVGRIRPLVESRLWRARLEGASGAVLIALGVRLAAERR